MKKTNTKKGFTIIELVIVIAVIGILAAVLIPTFSGVIEKANESAAMQAARNEYEVYLSEHAAELTGKENFVIVYKTYAFKVTNGQFDATALKATDVAKVGKDLTVLVKSVTTGAAAPTAAPVEGVENYYATEECNGTPTTSGWTANTTYYYMVEIGNPEVAIYTAA